jgi:Uma2 family endonuclease
MSAVTVLRVPPDGWTVDDLPDREDFRYELVDGALLVTPTPSVRHAFAASRLHAALLAAVPVGVEVISPGVHFDRRNYREPDLGLVRSTVIAQERIGPGDLLLAVEVMSPSSVATDRVASRRSTRPPASRTSGGWSSTGRCSSGTRSTARCTARSVATPASRRWSSRCR